MINITQLHYNKRHAFWIFIPCLRTIDWWVRHIDMNREKATLWHKHCFVIEFQRHTLPSTSNQCRSFRMIVDSCLYMWVTSHIFLLSKFVMKGHESSIVEGTSCSWFTIGVRKSILHTSRLHPLETLTFSKIFHALSGIHFCKCCIGLPLHYFVTFAFVSKYVTWLRNFQCPIPMSCLLLFS